MPKPLAACTAWLLASALGWAHGPLEERIELLRERVLAQPGDAGLQLEYAEVLRVAGDWQAAARAYERAERLAPGDTRAVRAHARMLLEARRPAEARSLLARASADPEALFLRGRAEAELGERRAAARDLARALPGLEDPQPEHYLEQARSEALLGRAGRQRALGTLERGLARLGPAVTLELAALQLEERLGRHAAALERAGRLLSAARRRAPWLERRALVLWSAGRRLEAQAELRGALEACARESRGVPADVLLAERLRARLAALQDGARAPEVADVL